MYNILHIYIYIFSYIRIVSQFYIILVLKVQRNPLIETVNTEYYISSYLCAYNKINAVQITSDLKKKRNIVEKRIIMREL